MTAARYPGQALIGGMIRDMATVTDVATNGYVDADGRPFVVTVGTAGDLAFELGTGELVELAGLAAGAEVTVGSTPVAVQKIRAAGTTVTSVTVGFFWY